MDRLKLKAEVQLRDENKNFNVFKDILKLIYFQFLFQHAQQTC
jgi:hypothetical protein